MGNFIFCVVYLEGIIGNIKLSAKWRNWYKAFSDTLPTGKVILNPESKVKSKKKA